MILVCFLIIRQNTKYVTVWASQSSDYFDPPCRITFLPFEICPSPPWWSHFGWNDKRYAVNSHPPVRVCAEKLVTCTERCLLSVTFDREHAWRRGLEYVELVYLIVEMWTALYDQQLQRVSPRRNPRWKYMTSSKWMVYGFFFLWRLFPGSNILGYATVSGCPSSAMEMVDFAMIHDTWKPSAGAESLWWGDW